MLSQALYQIEKSIDALQYEEKFTLLERLVRKLRNESPNNNMKSWSKFEEQIALMAKDPEMQTELKSINDEFLQTENDGLESL